MKTNIDATDRRIIRILENNAKATIKEISESLRMSRTPIFERIKKLEQLGYIKGYTAVVDSKAMGFQLMAFATVTLETHHTVHIKQFVEDIQGLEEVMECHHMAGQFDYLLKIYAKDMDDYQLFISEKLASLDNIGKVQSSFVMSEIKSEWSLPILS